jgi:hypothetical protein
LTRLLRDFSVGRRLIARYFRVADHPEVTRRAFLITNLTLI